MIPKHTVLAALKNLKREVEVVVYADKRLFEFVKEISEINKNVRVKFEESEEPRIGKGAIRVGNIFFHGLPRYTELESFLTALKIDTTDCKNGIVILTFVSTFCPNCRSSVDAINTVINAKKYAECLEHHVVDVEYMPELAEKYGVESVPVTFVGNFRFTGAMDEKEAEKNIKIAIEKRYDVYFADKLAKGEIEEVKSIVVQNPELVRVLAGLISYPEFIVKLGAMAAIEALHAVDPKITEMAKDVVREMISHEDVRVREDAAMMLGIIGGEEEIEVLEKAAEEGGRVADSVREAITNIRERIGR